MIDLYSIYTCKFLSKYRFMLLYDILIINMFNNNLHTVF